MTLVFQSVNYMIPTAMLLCTIFCGLALGLAALAGLPTVVDFFQQYIVVAPVAALFVWAVVLCFYRQPD